MIERRENVGAMVLARRHATPGHGKAKAPSVDSRVRAASVTFISCRVSHLIALPAPVPPGWQAGRAGPASSSLCGRTLCLFLHFLKKTEASSPSTCTSLQRVDIGEKYLSQSHRTIATSSAKLFLLKRFWISAA